MAKRSTPPPQPRPANIRADAVGTAIEKLERRLGKLREVDPSKTTEEDLQALAESVCTPFNAALVEIFGPDTIEYERCHIAPAYFLLMGWGSISHAERIDTFRSGLALAKTRMETELSLLRERQSDKTEDKGSAALRAYAGLDLHPDINDAAGKLFHDGHYSNAIEDAVKALNSLVRYRSGLELDGSALMEAAFSPKKPVLRFNDLADQSDIDEQRGFMQMFSGAVAGLRNPRAHKLIKDDAERALEFIAFISLLAKLATAAVKNK